MRENPYDELLNEHSLADTSTTEQTNLTTTSVGSKQIDDLDTSDQNLSTCRLFDEFWRRSVNRGKLGGLDGSSLVDRVTSDVHDATECAGTNGNHDGSTSIGNLVSTSETLSTYCASAVVDIPQMC